MLHVSTSRGRGAFLRPGSVVPVRSRTEARPVRVLGRRPVLDGLRGIAVMLVISEHTGLLGNGFMGVDIFFVLSGFLITTLLCEERERTGRVSLRGFYRRRARRLLPALGLLAVLALIVNTYCWGLAGWGMGWKLATTFGFVNNWVAGLGLGQGHALGALNPTWSLAQEDQFYLLWPLALILMVRRGLAPHQMVLRLGLAIAAILLIEPVLSSHLGGYSTYYDPIDRAAELLLGCAGALLWRHRLVPLRGGVALRGLGELALIGLTFTFAWLAWRVHPADPRWVFLAAAGLTLPGLLLLVELPGSLIGRLVSAAPLRWIGKVSYGLYLIHLLIRNAVGLYLPQLTVLEMAALTVAGGLLLATLSYQLIEQPILRGRLPVPLAWLMNGLRRGGEAVTAAGPSRSPRPNRPATALRPSPIRSSA